MANDGLPASWLEILRAALHTGQLPERWPSQEADAAAWRSLAEGRVALQALPNQANQALSTAKLSGRSRVMLTKCGE